jgi:molybdenum cofactor guanylyltransferase
MTRPDLTAFVLAGGKSTRMGTDKAFLQVGGRTLLERSLFLARSAAASVRIVGKEANFSSYAPTVEDIFADRGPLGGIHAALRSSHTDLNFVLSVDTPFLTEAFVGYLIDQVTPDAVVTVPRTAGRWQPLCAVYRQSFADVAETALLAGKNKIDALFGQVAVRALDEETWQPLGFAPAMFRNLNTPEEFHEAQTTADPSFR